LCDEIEASEMVSNARTAFIDEIVLRIPSLPDFHKEPNVAFLITKMTPEKILSSVSNLH
jgi:hypothetical protein